jgi:hypothetical protein
MDNPFGEVIYGYSRKQAIEDGVLIDVTNQANQFFQFPMAITAEVYGELNNIPKKHAAESFAGRLHDVLFMAFTEVKKGKTKSQTLMFSAIVNTDDKEKIKQYKMVIGPGDNMEPVLTIMKPHED